MPANERRSCNAMWRSAITMVLSRNFAFCGLAWNLLAKISARKTHDQAADHEISTIWRLALSNIAAAGPQAQGLDDKWDISTNYCQISSASLSDTFMFLNVWVPETLVSLNLAHIAIDVGSFHGHWRQNRDEGPPKLDIHDRSMERERRRAGTIITLLYFIPRSDCSLLRCSPQSHCRTTSDTENCQYRRTFSATPRRRWLGQFLRSLERSHRSNPFQTWVQQLRDIRSTFPQINGENTCIWQGSKHVNYSGHWPSC